MGELFYNYSLFFVITVSHVRILLQLFTIICNNSFTCTNTFTIIYYFFVVTVSHERILLQLLFALFLIIAYEITSIYYFCVTFKIMTILFLNFKLHP